MMETGRAIRVSPEALALLLRPGLTWEWGEPGPDGFYEPTIHEDQSPQPVIPIEVARQIVVEYDRADATRKLLAQQAKLAGKQAAFVAERVGHIYDVEVDGSDHGDSVRATFRATLVRINYGPDTYPWDGEMNWDNGVTTRGATLTEPYQ
jgi:hypothetical protein